MQFLSALDCCDGARRRFALLDYSIALALVSLPAIKSQRFSNYPPADPPGHRNKNRQPIVFYRMNRLGRCIIIALYIAARHVQRSRIALQAPGCTCA